MGTTVTRRRHTVRLTDAHSLDWCTQADKGVTHHACAIERDPGKRARAAAAATSGQGDSCPSAPHAACRKQTSVRSDRSGR